MSDPLDIIGHVSFAYTGTSANGAIAAIPTGSRASVQITLSSAGYFASGVGNTTAATTSDKFLPAGVPIQVILPKGHNYIAVIRASADGIASVITLG